MTFRFLTDECLTPELAQMAVDAGHVESTCVTDRGLAETKDWKLIEHVVASDFTLVTLNSFDYRGGGPGQLGGQHAKQTLHAGLICLNSVQVLDLQRQRDLFQIALDQVATMNDLVNQALEVFEEENGYVEVVICDFPESA